jgi:hypothetical protein
LAEELLLPHQLLAALLETASDYPAAVYTAPTSIYGYTITSTNLEVKETTQQTPADENIVPPLVH